MTQPRDLTADGVKIVDRGTPEQAMRFLSGIHCENPDEMDSVSDFHVWAQIPAPLCSELVAMALVRTPQRHNEDRTLVEIVHLRKQEDPDAADWDSFDLPNAQEHLTAIVRQAMQQDDYELEALEELALEDSKVIPLSPRRHLASVPDIA